MFSKRIKVQNLEKSREKTKNLQGINVFASLPPVETREVATACYVGSDTLLKIKLQDSVQEGHSLFNVDPFYSPSCRGVLA